MALDPGIVDSVSNTNFKVMAELTLQNTIANQQAMQLINQKATANSLIAMDQVKELSALVVELGAALSAIKGPPTTST